MKKIIMSAAFAGVLVGCQGFEGGQVSDEQSNLLSEVSQGHKTGLTDRPYCEVDTVDYELDTHLIAFEMVDKTSVGFGFNLLSGFAKSIGLNFKMDRAQMIVSMHLSESLRPTDTIADITGRGKSTKTDVGASIDFAKFGVDVGYFYQTPLSKLTKETVQDSFRNLKQEMSSIETPWRTRAVYMYPVAGQMIVPVGTVAGLRLGDQLQVYNVEYVWTGTPCESDLLFERKKSTAPVAIVQVVQLEKNAALVNIIDKGSDEPIDLGALVEVFNLPLAKGEKSRELARAVRLRSFESEKLALDTGSSIDLGVYIEEQTRVQMSSFGYYPRK